MATTGFWPVRGKLKEIIDYAENPDKTTAKEYLDDDLYAALRYAESDRKTDRKMYVTGINCSKSEAYSQMIAVKRKFGERGKITAYHGFQSFEAGEVTPEEAHRIGIETARRMWGDRFQVVVTTHLNTDNLHNHFVINSVSFKDGRKYRNSLQQHHEIREISDEVCREYGKSVLEHSDFYKGKSRGEYRAEKNGTPTHRQMLKRDIEYCLKYSDTWERFAMQLSGLGYTIDWTRMSVKGKGWTRSVRLSNIGYTEDEIQSRLDDNRYRQPYFLTSVWNYHLPQKNKSLLLTKIAHELEFDIEHSRNVTEIYLDLLFLVLINTLRIFKEIKSAVIMSVELRHCVKDLTEYIHDHDFLNENGIRTFHELDKYIADTKSQIQELEHERSSLRNKIRREKSPEIKAANREERSKITEHIEPLRKKLKRAKRISEKSPHIYELLKTEAGLERPGLYRNYER